MQTFEESMNEDIMNGTAKPEEDYKASTKLDIQHRTEVTGAESFEDHQLLQELDHPQELGTYHKPTRRNYDMDHFRRKSELGRLDDAGADILPIGEEDPLVFNPIVIAERGLKGIAAGGSGQIQSWVEGADDAANAVMDRFGIDPEFRLDIGHNFSQLLESKVPNEPLSNHWYDQAAYMLGQSASPVLVASLGVGGAGFVAKAAIKLGVPAVKAGISILGTSEILGSGIGGAIYHRLSTDEWEGASAEALMFMIMHTSGNFFGKRGKVQGVMGSTFTMAALNAGLGDRNDPNYFNDIKAGAAVGFTFGVMGIAGKRQVVQNPSAFFGMMRRYFSEPVGKSGNFNDFLLNFHKMTAQKIHSMDTALVERTTANQDFRSMLEKTLNRKVTSSDEGLVKDMAEGIILKSPSTTKQDATIIAESLVKTSDMLSNPQKYVEDPFMGEFLSKNIATYNKRVPKKPGDITRSVEVFPGKEIRMTDEAYLAYQKSEEIRIGRDKMFEPLIKERTKWTKVITSAKWNVFGETPIFEKVWSRETEAGRFLERQYSAKDSNATRATHRIKANEEKIGWDRMSQREVELLREEFQARRFLDILEGRTQEKVVVPEGSEYYKLRIESIKDEIQLVPGSTLPNNEAYQKHQDRVGYVRDGFTSLLELTYESGIVSLKGFNKMMFPKRPIGTHGEGPLYYSPIETIGRIYKKMLRDDSGKAWLPSIHQEKTVKFLKESEGKTTSDDVRSLYAQQAMIVEAMTQKNRSLRAAKEVAMVVEQDYYLEPKYAKTRKPGDGQEPNPVDGYDAVKFRDKGKIEHVMMRSDIAEYWIKQPFSAPIAMSTIGWFTGTRVRKMTSVSHNIAFGPKSVPRDMGYFWLTTPGEAQTGIMGLKDYMFDGVKQAPRLKNELQTMSGSAKIYFDNNGHGQTFSSHAYEETGLPKHFEGAKPGTLRHGLKVVNDQLTKSNVMIETLLRINQTERLMGNPKYGRRGKINPDTGLIFTEAEAVHAVNTTLNFHKRGSLGAWMNEISPFFTATTNILAGYAKAAKRDPKLFLQKSEGYLLARVMMSAPMYAMKGAAMAAVPAGIKLGNIVIPLWDYVDEKGVTQHFYAKIPTERSPITVTHDAAYFYIMDKMHGSDTPHAYWNAIKRLDFGTVGAGSLIPPVFEDFIAMGYGVNPYTGRKLFNKANVNPEGEVEDDTHPLARKIAGSLNTFLPVDISPVGVEHSGSSVFRSNPVTSLFGLMVGLTSEEEQSEWGHIATEGKFREGIAKGIGAFPGGSNFFGVSSKYSSNIKETISRVETDDWINIGLPAQGIYREFDRKRITRAEADKQLMSLIDRSVYKGNTAVKGKFLNEFQRGLNFKPLYEIVMTKARKEYGKDYESIIRGQFSVSDLRMLGSASSGRAQAWYEMAPGPDTKEFKFFDELCGNLNVYADPLTAQMREDIINGAKDIPKR